eukprot:CAMPEP_0174707752 /NCGR_PEP_ID=MMETSP1094-20130205/10186_1 /TAXON_ID=156173 /ORGANISM="Chrysochromulina brevifilum, Strain UTEX LB 985" /LENGTH=224 /DNA_ID=CAMNT_0015906183 /DNA_START=262 /DNA_END=936 /DNA_ORIENTATION=-
MLCHEHLLQLVFPRRALAWCCIWQLAHLAARLLRMAKDRMALLGDCERERGRARAQEVRRHGTDGYLNVGKLSAPAQRTWLRCGHQADRADRRRHCRQLMFIVAVGRQVDAFDAMPNHHGAGVAHEVISRLQHAGLRCAYLQKVGAPPMNREKRLVAEMFTHELGRIYVHGLVEAHVWPQLQRRTKSELVNAVGEGKRLEIGILVRRKLCHVVLQTSHAHRPAD